MDKSTLQWFEFTKLYRLQNWAKKALKSNGPMENIAKFNFKSGSNTKLLARLKSGFLLKDILDRFTHKIEATLKPDYSLWFYSAHDFTVSSLLNSLGLFEVSPVLFYYIFQFVTHSSWIDLFFHIDSHIFRPTHAVCTLNYIKPMTTSITFNCSIGNPVKIIHRRWIYQDVEKNVQSNSSMNCTKKSFQATLNLNVVYLKMYIELMQRYIK